MRIVLTIFIIIPLFTIAQMDPSNCQLVWENSKTWEQIRLMAKKENKYVFVDFYATWCKPCKLMDKNVYTNPEVCKILNKNFISIKVQLDTTENDNQEIRNWYTAGKQLRLQNKIISLPTFLFFSPSGDVVHKGIGYKSAKNFIELTNDAIDSTRQYYTLLKSYQEGKKDYSKIQYISYAAIDIDEAEMAEMISNDYLNNFLFKKSKSDILKQDNIKFIKYFTRKSSQKGFEFFWDNSNEIDEIMGIEKYSQKFIDQIIMVEEINPFLLEKHKDTSLHHEPNWKSLSNKIKRKYNSSYASRIILDGKIKWFEDKRDWKNYCQNLVERVDKYGPFGDFSVDWQLNVHAWDLFERSSDVDFLLKALNWSDSSIKLSQKPMPQYLDTYANLLYKLGKHNDALLYEAKAANLAPNDKEIQSNFEKMRRGEPTW